MKYAIDHQRIFLAKQMYNRAWDEQVESGFRREDLQICCAAIFDGTRHMVIDYDKMEEVHQ